MWARKKHNYWENVNVLRLNKLQKNDWKRTCVQAMKEKVSFYSPRALISLPPSLSLLMVVEWQRAWEKEGGSVRYVCPFWTFSKFMFADTTSENIRWIMNLLIFLTIIHCNPFFHWDREMWSITRWLGKCLRVSMVSVYSPMRASKMSSSVEIIREARFPAWCKICKNCYF